MALIGTSESRRMKPRFPAPSLPQYLGLCSNACRFWISSECFLGPGAAAFDFKGCFGFPMRGSTWLFVGVFIPADI